MNLCDFHLRGEEEPNFWGSAIFFLLRQKFLCIMRPQQTHKYFCYFFTQTQQTAGKGTYPYSLTQYICPRRFQKWHGANFGEVLVEGTLLPSLWQIPPLLPKNLNFNCKINGSDIFRSIMVDNQLPLKCLLPGILLT
jgi:hypothetical protein